MKAILVLLAVVILLCLSVSANAQCKIMPEAIFLFPDGLKGDFIKITGTWMSVEKPYDPRNPNTSVISCDRQNYECRVTTAYILGGVQGDIWFRGGPPMLDLWEWSYKVVVWNSETIVAVGVPWLKKQSDEGRPVLTIKQSDKSVVEDNSTLVSILFHYDLPKNRRMVLKEGNPLHNKSLKEFYGM
jgi:hypothetical protein